MKNCPSSPLNVRPKKVSKAIPLTSAPVFVKLYFSSSFTMSSKLDSLIRIVSFGSKI
ncbi:hypothetical protein FTW_1022 [Francisella tularensis subsp. tularensis WY96-3418]|nr:hypothetical protein FTW_1022 [Francisella tularensis subsp. tularensis WY96-3418]